MATVTLYGKPGCHLCDQVRAELEHLRGKAPFALEEIDVSIDPALERDYGERIPVVAVDGDELCEYELDATARERLLARVAGS
jgi:glutaredoxin